jgi:hypothetical protein
MRSKIAVFEKFVRVFEQDSPLDVVTFEMLHDSQVRAALPAI